MTEFDLFITTLAHSLYLDGYSPDTIHEYLPGYLEHLGYDPDEVTASLRKVIWKLLDFSPIF